MSKFADKFAPRLSPESHPSLKCKLVNAPAALPEPPKSKPLREVAPTYHPAPAPSFVIHHPRPQPSSSQPIPEKADPVQPPARVGLSTA
jgi:hypothetical protein